MRCSYLNYNTSHFSISPWLPISLVFKFKTNCQTKQLTCNNFSNGPIFEQTIASLSPLIFSSTTVIVTTSFCFSVSSIVVKLSCFGISNCSVIRKFGTFHQNELFTSLMGLVIRVAVMPGEFIFCGNVKPSFGWEIISNYINSGLKPIRSSLTVFA